MPHQNTVTGSEPRDRPTEQDRKPGPKSYASKDVGLSSLAPPAAGETADYQDEGEALGGEPVQQGATNTNRPGRTEAMQGQGPRTRAANKDIFRGRM